MISIITGDIINSRKSKDIEVWQEDLKSIFRNYGETPAVWEIFRGDSFQLEINEVSQSLLTAIHIKSAIKLHSELDVRMAIGIGEKSYSSPGGITESNGDAFVRSGQLFEELGRRNLAISSPWPEMDEEMNLYIELALMTMDHWTPNSAELVKLMIENPDATQRQLAGMLGITQGRISERLKRSGLDQILKVNERYRKLIHQKLQD